MSKTFSKAVLGGFIADAACMPTHWIYDSENLKSILYSSGKRSAGFFEKLSCPFYSPNEFPGHYELGMNSPYGEQGLVLLKYLETNNGDFRSGEHFAEYLYSWASTYSGRKDHATNDFLAAGTRLRGENASLYPNAGSDDKQANCFFKVGPILSRYGRSKECDDKVEAAVRAHQNNNQTVDYALAHSRLLKMLILHGLSMEDAVSNLLAEESSLCEEVKESTRKGWCERESARLDKNGWDEHLVEYGKRLSEELYVTAKEKNPETKEYMRPIMALTCSFPQSYFCALKIVGDTLKSFEDQEDIDVFKDEAFAFAVNRNINFGGDTCGRSFLIGTLMVALGADIPLNWVKLAKNTDLILKVTHMLEEKNSME
mmetsp:Transcript_14242/g.18662  ORF Transcript_14242/g.18662 Transcript_14242/m.18662 type:complete len:371 (-) Transcript_14242:1632-2744(-)